MKKFITQFFSMIGLTSVAIFLTSCGTEEKKNIGSASWTKNQSQSISKMTCFNNVQN